MTVRKRVQRISKGRRLDRMWPRFAFPASPPLAWKNWPSHLRWKWDGPNSHLPSPISYLGLETLEHLTSLLGGRYQLERELGVGGMATVYLARDVKHDRHVAIKVLRPDLAHSLGPERFLREIHIVAKLQHPHILGLIDSGEADGMLYYVMPYVTGESLRVRLAREGEMPISEAVWVLREIADALAHAHG